MKSRIAYKLLIFSTLLMLFVLGLAGSAIAERDVEQESVIWNGHTYCAYNTYLTPLEAKERCKELGGHLVTISSRKENKTVYKLVKKIGQDALTIGATDDGHEGTWEWVTGEPFTYSNWHAGEPNNGLGYGQQYSQMYASDGTWDDYFGGWDGCSERKGFVCEWDYIKVYAPTGIKVSQSGSNEIKLEWIAGVNAKEYEIYRATGSNGDFTKIETTKKLKYTDKKVKNGKTYRYKIRAKNGSATSGFTSDLDAYPMAVPKSVKAKYDGSRSVTISWKAVQGANKYCVYQKTPNGSLFSPVATVTDTRAVITISAGNGTYKYYVIPMHDYFYGLKSSTQKVRVKGF